MQRPSVLSEYQPVHKPSAEKFRETDFDPRGDSQKPARFAAPFGSAENSSGVSD
jgi:hypothetical protein